MTHINVRNMESEAVTIPANIYGEGGALDNIERSVAREEQADAERQAAIEGRPAVRDSQFLHRIARPLAAVAVAGALVGGAYALRVQGEADFERQTIEQHNEYVEKHAPYLVRDDN